VESIKGDFTLHPVQASDDPARVGKVEVVLLGVKAWQVPEAALAMRPLIGEDTFVVPLQNGVDAPSQLAAVLGKRLSWAVYAGLPASWQVPDISGIQASSPKLPLVSWTTCRATGPHG
jgi:2-dehydropantoate 2-reductase